MPQKACFLGRPCFLTAFRKVVEMRKWIRLACLPMLVNVASAITFSLSTGAAGWQVSQLSSVNGAGPNNLQLSLYGSAPTVDPVLTSARNDIIAVKVTYPFDEARWSPVNLYTFFGNWDLADTAYWPCLIDVPVAINAVIPSQPQ